jgi:hypothetical protein
MAVAPRTEHVMAGAHLRRADMMTRRLVPFPWIVPAVLALFAVGIVPASAAGNRVTVKVTTTADLPAPCSGAVSLRCAILRANQAGSQTTITFDIPTSDPGCAGAPTVCTITPTTALPPLKAAGATINAYTQPGSAANDRPLAEGDNAKLGVRLDGSAAGRGVSGLVLGGDAQSVRGLSITNFIVCFDCGPIPGLITGGSGVEVRGKNDVVAGNFLGVLPDGVTAGPNEFAGVDVTGSGAGTATIGGTNPASSNVLSGNKQCTLGDCEGFGAYVDVTGVGTVIQRNLFGTTAAGQAELPNAATGLVVLAAGARITGNVISGSGGDGVLTAGTGITVSQNLIGTDATGRIGVENHSHGLDVQATGNVIRGNVISYSGDTGLVLSSGQSIVQGNLIGTDVTGTEELGNGFDPSAIFLGQPINGTDGIVACGSGNTIGGAAAGQGNLVSGNRGDGIFLGGDSNIVQGNRVGTSASGGSALPNHVSGIGSRAQLFQGVGFCQQAPAGPSGSHTIGGAMPGAGNLISGNLVNGIDLVGTHDDVIAGNRIGTDAGGTAPLGNGKAGVILAAACDEHGCTPSSRNQIRTNLVSANGDDGIIIVGTGGGTGNVVAGNLVGTDASGHTTLGNAGAGVAIGSDASADVVGGAVLSDRNLIAGNTGPGVLVGSDPSDVGTHVVVQGNATFANGGLGIDLAPEGVVDCSTPPPGPNGYVPCPVITSATTTAVAGTACAGCTVEVFVALAGTGDSGHGEGARLLGRAIAAGDGAWGVPVVPGALASGDQVTGTATTPLTAVLPQTSEFGANATVSSLVRLDRLFNRIAGALEASAMWRVQ